MAIVEANRARAGGVVPEIRPGRGHAAAGALRDEMDIDRDLSAASCSTLVEPSPTSKFSLPRANADTLHKWLTLHRQRSTDGTATARAIDYSLKRRGALTRFLAEPAVPIDNNWIENRTRPIAIGGSNWLFAGSLRGGQRAAAMMSLIQSARLTGHDLYTYLRDVLERLPTQPNSRLDELLPYHWTPTAAS
jgi:hypothetical protein